MIDQDEAKGWARVLDMRLDQIAILERKLKIADKAIIQMLDDGGYIKDYDKDDKPVFDTERTQGGCFCHAAALQAMEAINSTGDQ